MNVDAGEIYDDIMASIEENGIGSRFDKIDNVFRFAAFCIYELGVEPDKLYLEHEVADIKKLVESFGYYAVSPKNDREVVCETS